MAEWDHFFIYKPGKAIITYKDKNEEKTIELDIIELPSGRYFLDKESVKKNGSNSPIYTLVGHEADKKRGITDRITDTKRLSKVIQEIEESLIK